MLQHFGLLAHGHSHRYCGALSNRTPRPPPGGPPGGGPVCPQPGSAPCTSNACHGSRNAAGMAAVPEGHGKWRGDQMPDVGAKGDYPEGKREGDCPNLC